MIENLYTGVTNANAVTGTNIKSSCSSCTIPLLKNNYFSEFKTALDKAKARANLGIADNMSLTWKNITGNIEDNSGLNSYLVNINRFNGEEIGFPEVLTIQLALQLIIDTFKDFNGEQDNINTLYSLVYEIYKTETNEETGEVTKSGKLYDLINYTNTVFGNVTSDTRTVAEIDNALKIIETNVESINTIISTINDLITISDKQDNALIKIEDGQQLAKVLVVNEETGEPILDENGDPVYEEKLVNYKGGLYVKDLSSKVNELANTTESHSNSIEHLENEVEEFKSKEYVSKEDFGDGDLNFIRPLELDDKLIDYAKTEDLEKFSGDLSQELNNYVKTNSDATLNSLVTKKVQTDSVETSFIQSTGTIKIEAPLEFTTNLPADSRRYVLTKNDLIDPAKLNPSTAWEGMEVIVVSDATMYILLDITAISDPNFTGWKSTDSLSIVTLTWDEYESRSNAGLLDNGVYYYIIEEDVDTTELPNPDSYKNEDGTMNWADYNNALEAWKKSLYVLQRLYMSAAWGIDVEKRLGAKANSSEIQSALSKATQASELAKRGMTLIQQIIKVDSEEDGRLDIAEYDINAIKKAITLMLDATQKGTLAYVIDKNSKDILELKTNYVSWELLGEDSINGNLKYIFVKRADYEADRASDAEEFTTNKLNIGNVALTQGNANKLQMDDKYIATEDLLLKTRVFPTYSEYVDWLNNLPPDTDIEDLYAVILNDDGNEGTGYITNSQLDEALAGVKLFCIPKSTMDYIFKGYLNGDSYKTLKEILVIELMPYVTKELLLQLWGENHITNNEFDVLEKVILDVVGNNYTEPLEEIQARIDTIKNEYVRKDEIETKDADRPYIFVKWLDFDSYKNELLQRVTTKLIELNGVELTTDDLQRLLVGDKIAATTDLLLKTKVFQKYSDYKAWEQSHLDEDVNDVYSIILEDDSNEEIGYVQTSLFNEFKEQMQAAYVETTTFDSFLLSYKTDKYPKLKDILNSLVLPLMTQEMFDELWEHDEEGNRKTVLEIFNNAAVQAIAAEYVTLKEYRTGINSKADLVEFNLTTENLQEQISNKVELNIYNNYTTATNTTLQSLLNQIDNIVNTDTGSLSDKLDKQLYREQLTTIIGEIFWLAGEDIPEGKAIGDLKDPSFAAILPRLEEIEKDYVRNAQITELVDIYTNMVKIEWYELVKLKEAGNLVPGTWYCITDYYTTTSQSGTEADNHSFYVIILALSECYLTEEAFACIKDAELYPDDAYYFRNCRVNAWELRYCLDNDSGRFAWAETSMVPNEDVSYVESASITKNFAAGEKIDYTDYVKLSSADLAKCTPYGRGVIYYMKDEFDNELTYDFKNIKFIRYLISAVGDEATKYMGWVLKQDNPLAAIPYEYKNVVGITGSMQYTVNFDSSFKYYWTFTEDLHTFAEASVYNCDQFAEGNTDVSYMGIARNKFTKPGNIHRTFPEIYQFTDDRMMLNNNVFCGNNVVGNYCDLEGFMFNTFLVCPGCVSSGMKGEVTNDVGITPSWSTNSVQCAFNKFGANFAFNITSMDFSYNTFGNDAKFNTFGFLNKRIIFGNSCSNNYFMHMNSNITLSDSCSKIRLGNCNTSNTFGPDCNNLQLGSKLIYNTFAGDNKRCVINPNYMTNCYFALGVSNLIIQGNGSQTAPIQNYIFNLLYEVDLQVTLQTLGAKYHIYVENTSTGGTVLFCLGDVYKDLNTVINVTIPAINERIYTNKSDINDLKDRVSNLEGDHVTKEEFLTLKLLVDNLLI